MRAAEVGEQNIYYIVVSESPVSLRPFPFWIRLWGTIVPFAPTYIMVSRE